jgi:hypothetical protein
MKREIKERETAKERERERERYETLKEICLRGES